MKELFIGNYGLEQVGQKVTAKGWVANIRNHGKLAFIELRDREGLLQVFVDSAVADFDKLHDLHTDRLNCERKQSKSLPAVNSCLLNWTITLMLVKIFARNTVI